MNRTKLSFGCATIAAIAVIFCVPTHAQSQFEDSANPNPKTGEKAVEKRPEKSVLAGGAKESSKPEKASESFCQCVGDSETASVERIEQALRGPLHSSGLDFVEQPLQDVVTSLQEDYGIPIKVDKPALEEAGIGTDTPVTVTLQNISLRSALKHMLKNAQLTYIIRDEVLIVTTHEDAEKQLKTCVYDVSSLTGERDSQIDALIDTIHSCVATDTWAENGGGQAEIRAVKPGLLVISQIQPVHEEIHSLLATIRKMQDARPAKANAITKEKHPAADVVTRSYILQLNPSNDNDTMRKQVRELIVQSLPEESWNGRLADGQAVVLSVFHDRIVVRQTPEVQEKLERILSDSGIATPAQAGSGNVGGPGGFRGMGRGGGGGGGIFVGPEGEGALGAMSGPGGVGPAEAAGPGSVAPGAVGEGISPEPAKSE